MRQPDAPAVTVAYMARPATTVFPPPIPLQVRADSWWSTHICWGISAGFFLGLGQGKRQFLFHCKDFFWDQFKTRPLPSTLFSDLRSVIAFGNKRVPQTWTDELFAFLQILRKCMPAQPDCEAWAYICLTRTEGDFPLIKRSSPDQRRSWWPYKSLLDWYQRDDKQVGGRPLTWAKPSFCEISLGIDPTLPKTHAVLVQSYQPGRVG